MAARISAAAGSSRSSSADRLAGRRGSDAVMSSQPTTPLDPARTSSQPSARQPIASPMSPDSRPSASAPAAPPAVASSTCPATCLASPAA